MEPKNKPFCSQNLILIAWLHFTIDMINTDDKKKKIRAKFKKFCKSPNVSKERSF